MNDHAVMIGALKQVLGEARVSTQPDDLALAASDLYSTGPAPVAVARPATPEAVAATVREAALAGYAIVPRGGGLSYTGGYRCGADDAVLLDLTDLDKIENISAEDMTITVQAGATWKQIDAALAPLKLRLPFFGTFSGAGATVGGGLSHGALFFGSARYGSAADIALGLEVVTADGGLLKTGQWGLRVPSRPVFRNFGPDLTGLFLHDGGALGIKTRAALRLIRRPSAITHASFLFDELGHAALALSEVARAGIAEDVYVLEDASVGAVARSKRSMRNILATAVAVTRAARGAFGAARDLAGIVLARPGSGSQGYGLHCTFAAGSRASAEAERAMARNIALSFGGRQVEPVVPRVARASPFPDLEGTLDSDGRRWAAVNAKVAHSQGVSLIGEHRSLVDSHSTAMSECQVSVTYLLSALSNHSFSFEAVFHWNDAWLPSHRHFVSPGRLGRLREPEPNPAARALVDRLRDETVEMFRQFGAASNQIGRTYPYLEALDDAPAALVRAVKRELDPRSLMNPGVLALGER